MLKILNVFQKTYSVVVKHYHLLFAFAEPVPGVTRSLLKLVREQDRKRKCACGGKKNERNCERGINNAVWLDLGRLGVGGGGDRLNFTCLRCQQMKSSSIRRKPMAAALQMITSIHTLSRGSAARHKQKVHHRGWAVKLHCVKLSFFCDYSLTCWL